MPIKPCLLIWRGQPIGHFLALITLSTTNHPPTEGMGFLGKIVVDLFPLTISKKILLFILLLFFFFLQMSNLTLGEFM
jgi:hypothetical protein